MGSQPKIKNFLKILIDYLAISKLANQFFPLAPTLAMVGIAPWFLLPINFLEMLGIVEKRSK